MMLYFDLKTFLKSIAFVITIFKIIKIMDLNIFFYNFQIMYLIFLYICMGICDCYF
jgi:hypothetical protein